LVDFSEFIIVLANALNGQVGTPVKGSTGSGVVLQQRSIPPLNADQLATTGITIVDNRLKDQAAVMASRHRGDGRSRPAPEKPIHPALVAAG
jgi:hypothetical protein